MVSEMSADGTRTAWARANQVVWAQVIIVHTFLSLQIQLQGGAVEDGHQNKGRVSPFSDPVQWLLDAFKAFDLDL